MRVYGLLFFMPFFVLSQSDEQRILSYIASNRPDKAETLLAENRALAANLNVLESLGDAHGLKKDWDRAMVHYKKLVELQPENATFHFKYAGVLGMKALSVNRIASLKYIDDIKKHFTEAARLNPQHLESRWSLIELYIQLPGIVGGSYKKAAEYARQLHRIHPI